MFDWTDQPDARESDQYKWRIRSNSPGKTVLKFQNENGGIIYSVSYYWLNPSHFSYIDNLDIIGYLLFLVVL